MNRPKRRPADEPVRLTLRLPADTVRRLREVARQRGLSVNGLLDEAAALALLEYEFLRPSDEAAPPR
ncbi:ribbon-helix-helix protein, CopG family [Azohydromonas caseinilytica]|uniref:Ribbon-helix-helix protein, CopG family n=1 Tax=Azohydromonas caseinilytica TaxID=2728836 RepID=A0A848F7Q1_9BURK|nr:ribbon-helix-helix protein, CopG family [Azohydromonas caseinilytica]NML14786.1 ribbon-helix-helix protein, CopG family [Azohydromonas caseinilytica]